MLVDFLSPVLCYCLQTNSMLQSQKIPQLLLLNNKHILCFRNQSIFVIIIFLKLLLFFQTNNKSSSSFQFHPALFNVVTPVMSLKKLTIPKQETISSRQRNRTSITVISDANVKFKFNAKKTFKTAILCVRFLVRLKRIKITPVLFNLDATRCNPYHMRNIRHSIGKLFDKVFLNTT